MSSTHSNRGFAKLDQERKRQIAQAGGRAAHKLGTAHEFSAQEASLAGKKGGFTVSRDRSHMATIGRLGGLARGQRLRAARTEEHPATTDGGSPAPG
jgi:general stress protein YciG